MCVRVSFSLSEHCLRVCVRERKCVCVCERERVCVCVRERERENQNTLDTYYIERKCVCVCERERECVCVCERERERIKTHWTHITYGVLIFFYVNIQCTQNFVYVLR